MTQSERIVLVGAGNLATSLGMALQKASAAPVAVFSRTLDSACALAMRLGCKATTDIASLPDADTVIISVSDNALPDVAMAVARRYPDALVLHTAGSVPMQLLGDAGCKRFGVLYPMQTFSKTRITDFDNVSIFVEGNTDVALEQILSLARLTGGRIHVATSEQRKYLHLAAVFACNFSNAMYAMSAELLESHGLSFEAMLPLIDETAAKVHQLHPRKAQTGPAQRGDTIVMDAQRNRLDGIMRQIYDLTSDYIQKKYD